MRSSSFAVLRLLADGTFRSGEAIGRALGVTRGSIWLAVREIEAHGLKVFKVRGRGYRLEQPFDALDAKAIRRKLRACDCSIRLDLLDECPSTNAALLQCADAPAGAALACELQTAGRGRRGTRWLSGLGDALTFSLLWRFESGPAALGGLSLAVGVACIRALERLGAQRVALKWPNDLVCDGAKLGGILIELGGEAHGQCVAVIGVGINVRARARLGDEIGQAVTDLAQCGSTASRNDLLADLLASIAEAAATFERRGFMAFREEWNRRHALQGRRVRIVLAERKAVDGIAAGVADDGALLLETPRGVERFHAGEVSVRRAA
jgi:BirA family biotin operon repressor/biotin-[acetyl-CoA-carboxylase] ligase